jgi:glycosyltransferase involved in cell wall biosynthesis
VLAPGADRRKEVTVVNAPGEYADLGDVRQKALAYAKGDWYVCWDDDDMFLPWHVDLGISHLIQHPEALSWHPTKSLWSDDGGTTYTLAQNNFEAAWITKMDFIKKFGHNIGGQSGGENLGWMLPLQSTELVLDVDTHPLWSYAYIWGNGLHHISSWEPSENFEIHLQSETDDGRGEELTPTDPTDIYKKYLAGIASGGEYTLEDIKVVMDRFKSCGIGIS